MSVQHLVQSCAGQCCSSIGLDAGVCRAMRSCCARSCVAAAAASACQQRCCGAQRAPTAVWAAYLTQSSPRRCSCLRARCMRVLQQQRQPCHTLLFTTEPHPTPVPCASCLVMPAANLALRTCMQLLESWIGLLVDAWGSILEGSDHPPVGTPQRAAQLHVRLRGCSKHQSCWKGHGRPDLPCYHKVLLL